MNARSNDVAAALGWITHKLPQFDPFPEESPCWPGLKAFAELSIVFARLAVWSPSEETIANEAQSAVAKHRAFLVSHCERPIYQEALRRDPRNAFAYAVPYLCLRSQGYRDGSLDASLAWLADLGLPRSVEAVPHRAWDVEHFLWKAGLASHPPWRRFYENTVLGGRRNLLSLDTYDAYAITHAVFYLTDFGDFAPALSGPERERLFVMLEALTIRYWRDGNWDVLGELLTSLDYLRLPTSLAIDKATEAFLGAGDANGATPADARGPRRGSSRRDKDGLADPETRHCYHTTLVKLLFLMAADSRRTP